MLRKGTSLDWAFLLSSAAIFLGECTGKFRLGTDQLLRGANEESRISVEGYAMAMIDEVEPPQYIRQRFTGAY